VKVTLLVRVPPTRAFEVFTEETNAWWGVGPKYRFGDGERGILQFEPGPNGRLFEQFSDGRTWEVGKVLAWEPGRRLHFEWRISNYAPGECTEVEVWFEPTESGTQVTLEHRGWKTLRPDHPARHGLDDNAYGGALALWWSDLLRSLDRWATTSHHPTSSCEAALVQPTQPS